MVPEIEAFRVRIARELDRIVQTLDGLDEAGVNWKPAASSANTLLVLATHALGAAEDHVVRQVAGMEITRSRDAEFVVRGSATGIGQRAAQVKQRIDDALSAMRAESLHDERDTPSGKRTVSQLLVHAVAHAAEHAGQAELTRDLYIAGKGK